MTLETVNQVDQQLATAFLRMTTAHDQLTFPESDDVAVDWRQVLVEIDEYGEAAMAIMELARDSLLPNLKAVKIQVKAIVAEIASLNALVAAEPAPTEPAPVARPRRGHPLVLIPESRPSPAPARARVQRHGTAYDRDANGQKVGPPRPCRNMAPAADPYCHNHGWQKPSA